MKTYKNIYDRIIDKDNLRKAFMEASKGKRNRKDVARILDNLEFHVDRLHDIMEKEEFRPSNHQKQMINDGFKQKKRYIIKPYYKYEQVVHHAIVQILAPTDEAIAKDPTQVKILNRGAYQFTCGSVKGRGAHYGKRYLERWIKNDHKHTKYILKIDIRHFFESVPHDILKMKLRKVIADEKTLRLLDMIIDAVQDGLPLGYYTSQWFANFYLQDLDHYIKQEILLPEKQKKEERYRQKMQRKGITDFEMPKYKSGVQYMVRYVDDVVMLGSNKRELKVILERIEKYCTEELKLTVKKNKQIFPLAKEFEETVTDRRGKTKTRTKVIGRALDFMGFLFWRNRTTIRKSVLIRITRKARRIGRKDKINWFDACSMISSMGYFDHTDTYNVFEERIKPYVNVKQLKIKVSNHGKKGSAVYAAA